MTGRVRSRSVHRYSCLLQAVCWPIPRARSCTGSKDEPVTPIDTPTSDSIPVASGPLCSVSAELERSLTQVARLILRLEVPQTALAKGESIDRAGYWLLVRLSSQSPIRLSELADTVSLDLSTVSRQMRDLVA